MSGFMRTLEKRIMKAAGMKKVTATVSAVRRVGNLEVPYEKKISLVYDNDQDYGPRWPKRIPRKYVAPVKG